MADYTEAEIARYRARGLMPLDAAEDMIDGIRTEIEGVLTCFVMHSPRDLDEARRRLRALHRTLTPTPPEDTP